MAALRITVLGSGTSAGVPTIGCGCAVCTSPDPRDRRLRPSILIRSGECHVLIDTTPDFRTQALRAGIRRLDAILFTHEHADHIMGLDDVRPFNFHQQGPIPFYAAPLAMETIQRCFQYIFNSHGAESAVPKLQPNSMNGAPFNVCGMTFEPIRLAHGRGTSYGYRFGNAAYLTDHSEIPEESLARLENLDVLFLDALRHKPHPTHSTVERSLAYVERLRPRRAYFTHICHDLPHSRTELALPPHIRLAYDGLEIYVGEPAGA
jgi:phosphoribosyl 1,2-cyclic phosphate phosphodiesterase